MKIITTSPFITLQSMFYCNVGMSILCTINCAVNFKHLLILFAPAHLYLYLCEINCCEKTFKKG